MNVKKKWGAWVLALALLCSMIPTGWFARAAGEDVTFTLGKFQLYDEANHELLDDIITSANPGDVIAVTLSAVNNTSSNITLEGFTQHIKFDSTKLSFYPKDETDTEEDGDFYEEASKTFPNGLMGFAGDGISASSTPAPGFSNVTVASTGIKLSKSNTTDLILFMYKVKSDAVGGTTEISFAPDGDSSYTNSYTFNGTVTSATGSPASITIGGTPAPETVTVTYKADGGTGDDVKETVNKDTAVTLKPADTFTAPAGKEFKAWNVGGTEKNPGESVTVSADTEIKAVWKDPDPVTVTVTYKADGGTGDDVKETVNKDTAVTLKPADTFKAPDGKEFKAWNVGGTEKNPGESVTVSADTEIKAVWKDIPIPTVTVTYKADGGTGDDVKETVNKDTAVTLKPADTFAAPDGKQFKAWDVNGEEKNPNDFLTVSADTEIKAVWEDAIPCTVKFDANGGENFMDDMEVMKGQKLTLPECAFAPLSGQKFKAWDVNGTEYQPGAQVEITADTTVKAVWEDLPEQGCYVATSVYGSYDCPQVWTLRRFRDNVLAETWYGRLFIKAYYAVSPTCVKLFGDTEIFQNFFRGILDPWVAKLQEDGFESTPYNDIDW